MTEEATSCVAVAKLSANLSMAERPSVKLVASFTTSRLGEVLAGILAKLDVYVARDGAVGSSV